MVVRYAGRALYSNELSVGPAAAGWAGPAVLGGARTSGTLLIINPDWATTDPPAAHPASTRACAASDATGACAASDATGACAAAGTTRTSAAVLALPGPAVLAAATGPDLPDVRAAIAAIMRPQHDPLGLLMLSAH